MHLVFTIDIINQRTIYIMHECTVSSRIIYALYSSIELREVEIRASNYHHSSTFMPRSPPKTPLRINDEIGWNAASVSLNAFLGFWCRLYLTYILHSLKFVQFESHARNKRAKFIPREFQIWQNVPKNYLFLANKSMYNERRVLKTNFFYLTK